MPETHPELFDPARSPDYASILEAIRRDDPIFYLTREELSSWVVTRYEDVVALLRDERLVVPSLATRIAAFSDSQKERLQPMQDFIRNNLGRTRERRRALRRITKPAFRPSAVDRLRGRVRDVLEELLAAVDPQRPVDLVASFSYPMPAMVMAEMLGAPARDRDRFIEWSQALIRFHRSYDFESMFEAQAGVVELLDYCARLIEERPPVAPGEGLLVDELARALREGPFEMAELATSCATFLMAGHENTSHLVGNVLDTLFSHPDQLALLLRDRDCIPQLIRETLRYRGVVPFLTREVAEDFSFRGHAFRKGQLISLSLFSANRDEGVFDGADRFEIGNPRSRHHLGFGHGANQCRGSHLATMEVEELLSFLFGRFPGMRPVAGGMETLCQPMLRRYVTRFEVMLDPAS